MFTSTAHTLPGPALSSCPRPGLLRPLEGLASRRDPAFSWDAEPWLTQAIAGLVTGLKLVSLKPVWPLDHATSWAGVESIFSSCWFATWSLALSNGVQDLPFHFCYSLKEPLLFSFSSNFYKCLSWKQPFWSGCNLNKWTIRISPISEGSQALSVLSTVPPNPSHQHIVKLMEERVSNQLAFCVPPWLCCDTYCLTPINTVVNV